MHREQNVCEQDVITGVVKKSLQTWHRRAVSIGANFDTGVPSQSEGSGKSKELSINKQLLCEPRLSGQWLLISGKDDLIERKRGLQW